MTAPTPGAIAIFQLQGQETQAILRQLTGRKTIPLNRAILANLAEIDQGLVILWSHNAAQIMPHGGVRIVSRLAEELVKLGVKPLQEVSIGQLSPNDALALYPEASCKLEALALAAIAQAASPAAIDLLLDQQVGWSLFAHEIDWLSPPQIQQHLAHADRLDRLMTPPTIAIVGRPNVGKSTLTNAMFGQNISIVADLPGTTRDWVAGMTQLSSPWGSLAVRWLDTPGIRHSDDMIEQQAIELAGEVITQADVVVALRDADTPWPDQLPRQADLWVMNKQDQLAQSTSATSLGVALNTTPEQPLKISAQERLGLDTLAQAIVGLLGFGGVPESSERLWAFTPQLRQVVQTKDKAMLDSLLELTASYRC